MFWGTLEMLLGRWNFSWGMLPKSWERYNVVNLVKFLGNFVIILFCNFLKQEILSQKF